MSDRICIFSQGRIEQIAAPDTIYDAPATPFVARFVGTVNLFEGEQARRLCGDSQQMMVRPERIRLSEAGSPGWSGEIREVEYLGAFVRYRVDLGERLEIIVNHPNEGQARLARGAQVSLSWPEQAIHRLSTAETGAQS
ncbi:Spermidine/putrescine import ATP-binding protein PotA [compost metagenome]